MKIAIALLSTMFAASSVLGLTYTTTLPWDNGNTLVIGETTDALGDVDTQTLSTITAGADAPLNTALTTPLATSRTSTRITNTRTRTTAANNGIPTTTGQRVVGVDTTAPPMRTTTYYYDPGSGPWVQATWTASVTGPPSVATAIIPEGTIQDYNSYQTVVNSAVLAGAEAAVSASGSVRTGAASRVAERTASWAALAVGVVGVGVGALVL